MPTLLDLWLPILLSAIAVWFVSMIATSALPHHKGDFRRIPDSAGGEDGFMHDLRTRGIMPGNYIYPDFRSRDALKSPKVEQALKDGPVGHLHVWKTPVTMGDKMLGSFVVYLLISTGIAYLTRLAVPTASAFSHVFYFAAAAGILAYCFSHIPSALWWGTYKRTIAANIVDGIAYAAITAAILAWRWPH